MAQYADAAALAAYPGGDAIAPADADTFLRTASRVVDAALKGVEYDTDVDGLPTDTDVAQAMSDATCAIALEANAAGTLTAGGATQEWSSVSIGNVSLSKPTGSTDALVLLGVPVPAAAIIALQSIGAPVVLVGSR
jgi:hypothetical protein